MRNLEFYLKNRKYKLHACINDNNINCLFELILLGYDLNERMSGFPILIYACLQEKYKIIHYLLDNNYGIKFDINQVDLMGNTMIHYLTNLGNLNEIKYLRSKNANISIKDIHGKEPIIYALSKGKFNILKYFIEEEIDLYIIINNDIFI